jgi:hypothetical protein
MKTGFGVARARRREWTGLAVLALPCMLYSMDLTVLNLAVPSLSTSSNSSRIAASPDPLMSAPKNLNGASSRRPLSGRGNFVPLAPHPATVSRARVRIAISSDFSAGVRRSARNRLADRVRASGSRCRCCPCSSSRRRRRHPGDTPPRASRCTARLSDRHRVGVFLREQSTRPRSQSPRKSTHSGGRSERVQATVSRFGPIRLDDEIVLDAEYAGHFPRPHSCERLVALGIKTPRSMIRPFLTMM